MTRTALIYVFISMCSLGISAGVGELYLRTFSPQPIIPRYVETSSFGIRKNIGNVQGVMTVPEYQHTFRTNSQGLRGTREYPFVKPPGVFRILVLGDSVALGHGVQDDETFAALLEDNLSNLRPTEVLNMGVSGFGTAEELIQLRHVGLRYQPDLVILAYFQNDPFNNTVSQLFSFENNTLVRKRKDFVPAIWIRDRLYSIPGWSFLCQHSHLVNLMRSRVSKHLIWKLAEENNIPAQTSKASTKEQMALTTALLQEMEVELENHGIPLMILNIPLIHNGEIIDNYPANHLRDHSINTVTIQVKEQIYMSHPAQDLSYEKDSHPTPHAHSLIAEFLRTIIPRIYAERFMI